MLVTLLYILFVLSALVLVVVILLQEGKGGGLGDMLGAAGQQAVGFKASGIHKFTATVAVIFICTAVSIHMINKAASGTTALSGGEAATSDTSGTGDPEPKDN